MILLTPQQAADLTGHHLRAFQRLLTQGRVTGAQQINGRWVIPENFEILPPKRKSRFPKF